MASREIKKRNTLMRADKLMLLASGVFLGGTLDHALLALMRSNQTPYGLRIRTTGNWTMAALDALIAIFLYRAAQPRRPLN